MKIVDVRCPKCDRPVVKGSPKVLPKISKCPHCKSALKPLKTKELGIGVVVSFQ